MGDWRILVADDLGDEGLARLRTAGEVEVKTGMDEATLRSALPGRHALVVRSATRVTRGSLEKADALVVIGRAGIGVDNIDLAAATERGIVVMNTPEAGMVTTAEHAIALLLALARHVPAADASMKAGRWDKKAFVGVEIRGKTLGVLGLGRIGRVVATRGQGLAMDVLGHDPYVPDRLVPQGVRRVGLDELLAESDFLSVHVPLSDRTRHLLGPDAFAAMKPGVRLVHAARGGIVDEEALVAALVSGQVAGAALDVFESEPLAEDHPLRSAPNVVLTPHLGASTREAKRAVSLDVADQVVRCLETGVALNGINVPAIPPGDAAALAPFLHLTRNLARILVRLLPGPLPASLRLTLQGRIVASAADALTAEMQVGALRDAADVPVTAVNAGAIARRHGVRVHTEATTVKRDFANLVRVEGRVGEERRVISGTVLGRRHARLVELDDFLVDAIPEGQLLLTRHHDRPGVLGAIGSILGEAAINLSRVEVEAAAGDEEPALGILNLDQPLPDEVLDRLRALDSIVDVKAIRCD